ncbi:unnamed protein product [Prunus brigantina]
MSTLETYDSHTASLAFHKGVTPGTKMHKSLVKTPPLDMREVLAQADGIIRLEEEELALSKCTAATISTPKHSYETIQGPRTNFQSGNLRNQARTNSPPTKLIVSLAKLFHENKGKGIFRTTSTLWDLPEKRDRKDKPKEERTTEPVTNNIAAREGLLEINVIHGRPYPREETS